MYIYIILQRRLHTIQVLTRRSDIIHPSETIKKASKTTAVMRPRSDSFTTGDRGCDLKGIYSRIPGCQTNRNVSYPRGAPRMFDIAH